MRTKTRIARGKCYQCRVNLKISASALEVCPQCHTKKLAYKVCRCCGYKGLSGPKGTDHPDGPKTPPPTGN